MRHTGEIERIRVAAAKEAVMRHSTALVVAWVLCLTVSFAAHAQAASPSYEDLMSSAKSAYDSGSFETAAKLYREAADLTQTPEAYHGYLAAAYEQMDFDSVVKVADRLLGRQVDLGDYRNRIVDLRDRAQKELSGRIGESPTESSTSRSANADRSRAPSRTSAARPPASGVLVTFRPSLGWNETAFATFFGAQSCHVGFPLGRWTPYLGMGFVYVDLGQKFTTEEWETDYYTDTYYKYMEYEGETSGWGLLFMPLVGVELRLWSGDPSGHLLVDVSRAFWNGDGTLNSVRRYYNVDGSLRSETTTEEDIWETFGVEKDDFSFGLWTFSLGAAIEHALTERLSIGGSYSLAFYFGGLGLAFDDDAGDWRTKGTQEASGTLVTSEVGILLKFRLGGAGR
jgi:hypothetical protein